MSEQPCLGQVQSCAMRLAILDSNGVPHPGANSLIVSDALAEMTVSPVYTDGNEVEEKNACDAVKVYYRGADTFKRADFTLRLVTPDPFVSAFLSDGDVLTVGQRKGFAAPPLGPISAVGVSIELWALRIDDGDLDVSSPYAHWAYPKAKNIRLGEWTHNNGAVLPQFSGQLYENPNWFDGPMDDWPSTSDRVAQWIPTNVLPVPTCGFQTLPVS